ncbi:hypothetical protein N7468_002923 [Penicillium chermesinum]|uniref:Amidase domain-containing protein n=1 Tax=Penicillium chermesinum TaxID=63820 RepID=A0A9W9P5M7_9EURO|nr:uncharacterized protein N7468_002923 [Penicillium chermesinum]KAJ5238304.1 hypothetical protein N7468_002923 [Penicillium chermesinum]KAJ6163971.1 hypothetical protein N7470_002643 [Penicillium chermesinum]
MENPKNLSSSNEKDVDLLTVDARSLQRLLETGAVTTLDLVTRYLAQIEEHDSKLHAMIAVTPKDLLEEKAKSLDQERASGNVRGPLHGIPIIIKDNIATHPSLGLPTTAGSLALLSSKPKANAKIVDQLIDAGLIIIGKANLAEFSNARGSDMHNGWSAVGGQTQSAYVINGLDQNDSPKGHSGTSGSSSGSAVGVSAGYAPFSIGTETDGSLVSPSGRAALYTIKSTIGLVPQDGIIPISRTFDAAGPMTKSSHDLALLLDVLAQRDPANSFTNYLTGSWSDISVAVLDPDHWKSPSDDNKPIEEAEAQMRREILQAYDVIEPKAKRFVRNVDLISTKELELDGENSEWLIILADMKKHLNSYLEDLAESEVRSMADIIEYNIKHADKELPPHHPRQDHFVKSQEQDLSPEDYERHLTHLRKTSKERGVEHVLEANNVDVILGPIEGGLSTMATAGGYPIAAMPLSYLDYNGRAFGVAAIANKGQEALLVKVMSAWEATFPPRRPPPQLVH